MATLITVAGMMEENILYVVLRSTTCGWSPMWPSSSSAWNVTLHNVELTFDIRGIKYIHKYVYKGHDHTPMEFGKVTDEIKQYLDARYVGAYEAIWRLMRHEIHHQQPAVVDVRVTLRQGHLYTKILQDRGEPNRCDTLTQW